MKTVDKIPDSVQTVILRVDYNLPLAMDGSVSDVTRVEHTRRTIESLLSAGKRVRIMTHWGRPDGQEEALSTRHLVPCITQHLGLEVTFDDQPLVGEYTPVDARLSLCENVRFYKEELSNDSEFVKSLAQRGEVFVNEAFSVSHREHASVCGLLRALPAYIGQSCAQEWRGVHDVRAKVSDMVVIVGGNKIETKLPMICSLLPHVRKVLLGPLIAKGMEEFLKKTHTNPQDVDQEKALKAYQEKVVRPIDVCTISGVCGFDEVHDSPDIKDIGPRTIELYTEEIFDADVIFMNGPLGEYERLGRAEGTRAIGAAVVHMAEKNDAFYALFGGGDTVAAMSYAQRFLPKNVLFSPSGGALLHAMTYGTLPGLEGLCA